MRLPRPELEPPSTAGPRGAARYVRVLRALLSAEQPGYAAIQSALLIGLRMFPNLATGVITARLLGPDGRGLYAAVATFPSLVGFAATAGIADALVVRLRREPGDTTATLLWGGAGAMCGCIAIGAAAYLAVPLLFGQHHSPSDVALARLTLVAAPFFASTVLARQAFAGQGRFLLSNLSAFLPHLFHGLIICALALAGALSVRAALGSLILAEAMSVTITVWFLRHDFVGSLVGARRAWSEAYSFARRAAPGDLLSLFAGWGDRLVLIPLLSSEQLGLYVVAYGLSRVVTITNPGSGILLSAMSKGSAGAAKTLHDLSMRCSLLLFGGIAAVALTLHQPLLKLVYGAEFVRAGVAFQLLVLQAVANQIAGLASQLYLASNRATWNSLTRLAELAVAVWAMVTLGARYGASGAAAGLLIGTSLRLTLLWIGFVTHLGVPLPRPWPTVDDVRRLRALFRP